jgi:hypothetical protein
MLFDLNAIRTPLLLLMRRPAGRRLPDLDLNPNRPTVVLAFAYLGTDQRGGEAFFPVGLGGIEPPTSALSVGKMRISSTPDGKKVLVTAFSGRPRTPPNEGGCGINAV